MNKKKTTAFALLVTLTFLFPMACAKKKEPPSPAELKNSARQDVNGWVFVHLEGTPREVGFQHGWHLAVEIDDLLRMFAFYAEKGTGRNWDFYRETAARLFWPKLEPEYQEEIEGITAGLKARLPKTSYDRTDITALNGWIEIAWYYIPWLADQAQPGAGDNKAPSYCSAFIATGSYTADGKIVIAHNSWVEYIIGERWRVVADIVPAQGNRILMDCMPGYIHSGDDFVINSAGLVYTETTISQYKGFNEDGTPEFMRARKAAQYGTSIDDFIRIMSADNNGAYANDWLVGDTKTNEIARLELGLKNQRVWRTTDGYFVGSNFPSDEKVIAEETTFDPNDPALSVLVRQARWEELMKEYKGEIDVEDAKLFEGDHIDASTDAPAANANTLCGHVDTDPKGLPEFSWPPFFPGGSVQGKVTSAELAKEMKLWARLGHPCGQDFRTEEFFKEHPEYAWQGKFLKDMKAQPWTLFEATR
ncbi:MAG: phospholipase B family protein [Candidatus Aminicenantes bacterium]|nr:phospholipase B family protein [Candidatus Aminicenantes bacterium]